MLKHRAVIFGLGSIGARYLEILKDREDIDTYVFRSTRGKFSQSDGKEIYSLQEVVDWSRHEKSVRRFLGWVAFFMWIACTHIIMGLVPKDLEYAHVPEGSLWAFIALLAPVLPIHLLYKACVRIVLSR